VAQFDLVAARVGDRLGVRAAVGILSDRLAANT
jgi:hypothetical protein